MGKISGLTALPEVAEGDLAPIIDVSDDTQATTGTTKKSTITLLADFLKDRVETLTGKTLTSPKVNEDVAVTSTATEINKLHGVTTDTSELNILDGVTANKNEINQLDGVTIGGTATGDVATIDDTQTLTNKTLTAPKINENVALTSTSTQLNLLFNQTVLRKNAIMDYGVTTITAGQTLYYAGGIAGATAYGPSYCFPCAGTIKNLYVYAGGSPGVGQTYTCTLMKDNSAQTVTCTVVEGANTANDVTHSFTVAAGNRVSLRVVASASAATTAINHGFEFDPS